MNCLRISVRDWQGSLSSSSQSSLHSSSKTLSQPYHFSKEKKRQGIRFFSFCLRPMALALSHSQARLLLSYQSPPVVPRFRRVRTAKTSVESPPIRAIRCSAIPNDQVALRTCKNCKTQYDPALNHPRACCFHTAHFGGTIIHLFICFTFSSSFSSIKKCSEKLNVWEICMLFWIV